MPAGTALLLVELGDHRLGILLHLLLAVVTTEEERAPFRSDLERLPHLTEMLAADRADGLLDRLILLGGGELLDGGQLVGRERDGRGTRLGGIGLGAFDLGRL